MKIRTARESDLSQITVIEAVSYPNPWPEILFRSYLGEEGFLVSVAHDDGICGYVITAFKIPTLFERIAATSRSVRGQQGNEIDHKGHLINIAVHPSMRGQGIGSKLLLAGIQYLEQLDSPCVELEVRVSNIAAIQMYRKHGFEVVGRVPDFYQGEQEDALLMNKSLMPREESR